MTSVLKHHTRHEMASRRSGVAVDTVNFQLRSNVININFGSGSRPITQARASAALDITWPTMLHRVAFVCAL